MTGIAISVGIAVATMWFTHKLKADNRNVAPRPELPRLGIAVVCIDCAGDEWRPVRTFLNSRSECDRCGGRSYILASSLKYTPKPVQIQIEREPFDAKGTVRTYYDSRRIM